MLIKKEILDLDTNLAITAFPNLDLTKSLFIDIETTGFSSKYHLIYMIGCIYYDGTIWHFIQYTCEKNEDEYELLYRFAKDIKKYTTFIHYNGKRFDIPFIKERMKLYSISSSIASINEIDIYIDAKKIKNYLPLVNLKLKTIEAFFNYVRYDAFTGGELIDVYKNFVLNGDNSAFEQLHLHNKEDLLGLYTTLKLYNYIHLFNRDLYTLSDNYPIINNTTANMLSLTLSYPSCLNHTININDWQIEFYLDKIIISTPIFHTTMNYYISDYKNYYFLPNENRIIHKSVANFVDSSHKHKATKDNCFLSKKGIFVSYLAIEGIKTFQEDVNAKKYMVLDFDKITPYIIIQHLFNLL